MEEVDGGLLVFDGTTGRAHALGRIAARVLRACDGERRAPEIAAVTRLGFDVVIQALDELEASGLLETDPAPGAGGATLRRGARSGAAVAGPLISTVLSPAAVAHARADTGAGSAAPGAAFATFAGVSGGSFRYVIAGQTGLVAPGEEVSFDRHGNVAPGRHPMAKIVFSAGAPGSPGGSGASIINDSGHPIDGYNITVLVVDATDPLYDLCAVAAGDGGHVATSAPAGHELTLRVSVGP